MLGVGSGVECLWQRRVVKEKGRSMLAADVIEELGAAVDKLFDHE